MDLNSKRKFLIVSPDGELRRSLVAMIDQHVDRATYVFAEDGAMALQKIDNDPPHVLVLQDELPKISGRQVLHDVLVVDQAPIATILLSDIPETDELAEFVALGQLHFLNPADIENSIGACLARALNWFSHGGDLEFSLKFLASGDYLMRQGDHADSVYLVKRGSLKAFVKETTNNVLLGEISPDILLGEISPKEFVGEMAYINGDVRSADVVAVTDCELIEIPIPHLDRLLFQKPTWAMALMRTLSKRMKATNDRLVHDS